MNDPMRVSVLGATGSIGVSTLDLLSKPSPGGPSFQTVALTAHSRVDELARAAVASRAEFAAIADPARYQELKSALAGSGVQVGAGPQAVVEAASRQADCVVAAIVGIAGLPSTLEAVRSGARVALANKESLVCAGDLLKREARKSGAKLLPVDSEHNAIFQVLDRPERVEKLILTASGGPFRDWSLERMAEATPEEARRHPNWLMGAKISVDCATMMNKGLELIEAVQLFDVPEDRIEILVHPQSIIHSLVAYDDGSVLAQLGMPDMRTPISFALSWPDRMPVPGLERLDLAKIGRLDFQGPDPVRFPALGFARAAVAAGGGACVALNGANEAAVEAFLNGRTDFLSISRMAGDMLEETIREGRHASPGSFEEIYDLDRQVRARCSERLGAAS